MTGRERLLAAIDRLAETPVGDRRRREARRHDARALAILLVPHTPTVCDECDVGGGMHAEGCPSVELVVAA
jgi:hypothetical protein